MIWIVIAIILAGYFISDAIRKSSNANAILNATIEQTKLDQNNKNYNIKQQLDLERSPGYQKQLNASLEFVEYLNEYHLCEEIELDKSITLLKNTGLADKERESLRKEIREAKSEKHKLQKFWFDKWDKLERQLNPRHNLLISNNIVGNKYDTSLKNNERRAEKRAIIIKLEKNRRTS